MDELSRSVSRYFWKAASVLLLLLFAVFQLHARFHLWDHAHSQAPVSPHSHGGLYDHHPHEHHSTDDDHRNHSAKDHEILLFTTIKILTATPAIVPNSSLTWRLPETVVALTHRYLEPIHQEDPSTDVSSRGPPV